MLALSRRNSNAAEILLFLHKLASVLEEYFKQLEEESIRDNFVILYELLDEMMDFGYPQTTESKILQEYITQGALRAFATAKMRYFWMLLRASIYLSIPMDTSCVAKLWVPSR